MSLVALLFAASIVQAERLQPGMPNPTACREYQKPDMPETACDDAIATEKDAKTKSVLLLRRAFLKDRSGDFRKYSGAIDDLDQAITLFPENAPAHHERAYLFNELGEGAKAEADLEIEAKLTPDQLVPYTELALAHFIQGKLDAQLADWNRAVEIGATAETLTARAHALMWLGRFDEASSDLQRAGGLAAAKSAAAASVARALLVLSKWRDADPAEAEKNLCVSPDPHTYLADTNFIGNCTRAFLAASSAKARADVLNMRAMVMGQWLRTPEGAIEDFRLAEGLNPNAAQAFNLGSILLMAGHVGESIVYLTRAINEAPTDFAYIARAQAEISEGDCEPAARDAATGLKLKEGAQGHVILGDVAYGCNRDAAAAKAEWLKAYELGGRDEGLQKRFAAIGVAWPPS